MTKRRQLEIGEQTVAVSSLDKVLYPETGFTKAQVIDYYIRVSEYLLPHFQDRPVTLKRYPDGAGSQFFYEKDAPAFTPKWVKTFPVPRRAGGPDIHYVLINNLATLVWCANAASLELHPFLHRVPEIRQPTSVVFDLDPGEGADLVTCAKVAFLLRDFLSRLGLEAFPKVSGSKGIQIYVPLNTPITYAETQPLARAIAELLAKEHPDLIVAEMTKSERAHKVFIDWSQNADFKTTVGVYSLRAKTARPFVSLPVTWDELKNAQNLYWGPDAALERLQNVQDLFAPVLTMKQSLPKSLGEYRQSIPAIDLGKLPKSPMRFVQPMQSELAAKLPEGENWQYEVKLDGYRALAVKGEDGVELYSRRTNLLNDRFPKIAQALGGLEDGVIVDGEIVALDSAGRPSFSLLQHHKKTDAPPIVFYVFDLLAYRGRDVTSLPLHQRRELLKKVLANMPEPIRPSVVLAASADDLIDAVKQKGFEGLIAKRSDSRYMPGDRGGNWVKYKVNQGQELVIGGYKPNAKNHFESLAVGYYDDKRLIFAAKIKTGFTPAIKDELFGRFHKLETKTCPFANLPEPKGARWGKALTTEEMKKYRWLRPRLVAQIEFTNWTSANNLRHAKFIALRDDKDPKEVAREIPNGR